MITMVEPIPAGNALRVYMAPPDDAEQWALLRKPTNDISGINDAGAVVVYRGGQDNVVLDSDPKLVNGATYWYQEFDTSDGTDWTASAALSAVPATTASGGGADVLSLVRQRLALWLAAMVANHTLTPAHGGIKVLTAPPEFDATLFPLVTVHLQNDAPENRATGELIAPDVFDDGADDWIVSEGALDRVQLLIVIWSLNPDERIALRQSVKAGLIANFPIFDDAGMVLIEWSFSDSEDFTSYNAPVYQASANFSCLAPTIVSSTVGAIDEVDATATAFFQTETFETVETD